MLLFKRHPFLIILVYGQLIRESHTAFQMEGVWSSSILENVNTIRGLSTRVLSRDIQRFLANDTLYLTQKLLEANKELGSMELESYLDIYKKNKEECTNSNSESFETPELGRLEESLAKMGCFVNDKLKPIFKNVDRVYTLSFDDGYALGMTACTTEFEDQVKLILERKFNEFYKALSFTNKRVSEMLESLGFNLHSRDNDGSFFENNKDFVKHMTELQMSSIVSKLDCYEIIANREKNTQDKFALTFTDEINENEILNSEDDLLPIEQLLSDESNFEINKSTEDILTQFSDEINNQKHSISNLTAHDLLATTTITSKDISPLTSTQQPGLEKDSSSVHLTLSTTSPSAYTNTFTTAYATPDSTMTSTIKSTIYSMLKNNIVTTLKQPTSTAPVKSTVVTTVSTTSSKSPTWDTSRTLGTTTIAPSTWKSTITTTSESATIAQSKWKSTITTTSEPMTIAQSTWKSTITTTSESATISQSTWKSTITTSEPITIAQNTWKSTNTTTSEPTTIKAALATTKIPTSRLTTITQTTLTTPLITTSTLDQSREPTLSQGTPAKPSEPAAITTPDAWITFKSTPTTLTASHTSSPQLSLAQLMYNKAPPSKDINTGAPSSSKVTKAPPTPIKNSQENIYSSKVLQLCTGSSLKRLIKKKPGFVRICRKVILNAILRNDRNGPNKDLDISKMQNERDKSSLSSTASSITEAVINGDSDGRIQRVTLSSSTSTTSTKSTTTYIAPTTTSKTQTTAAPSPPQDKQQYVQMKYCFDKNNRQIAQLLRILKQCGKEDDEKEECCIQAKIKIDSLALKDPKSKLAGLRKILLQLIKDKGFE
ncbi:uncharacterized protein [Lepeophtheirus salmonis]|uniref:uncharacterized protein n=1 Tax=Lepeophtheirus salmonis TaxID=72036 RepID=UPI001AE83D6C|nr:flocculation protein FLO11-like [Lepeophtheirus salmonis]